MINYELDGKVAVITGGASGIGLSCAHAIARSGAAVCLWDLAADPLAAAVTELEQYGQPTRTAVVDVSDSGQVSAGWRPSLVILVASTSSLPTLESAGR
jgi:2-dehydro-3-deoxy-L-rhamnonate dehydrogenase (NAD+)